MKFIYFTLLLLLFTGCDMIQSDAAKEEKRVAQKALFEKKVSETKEIQLKKLDLETQKELALLASKKELAEIEKAKVIEKIRIEAELQKQKVLLEQQKVQAAFDQKLREQEQKDSLELKRYLILSMTIIVALLSYFGFYYFKKKREDKLRAYNDNLEKYLKAKENEARVKIAEKMLDAISSGHLDKTQESQLISAFTGEANGSYQKQLESTESKNTQDTDDEIIDVTQEIQEKEK